MDSEEAGVARASSGLCLDCHRFEHGWGEVPELRRVHAAPEEPEGEARHPVARGRSRPPFGERRGWRMPGPVWGFLEPCVLLLLQRGPQHGYALLAQLTEHGFVESEVDVGNLYRAPRRIEEAGWARSEWSNAGLGPARHVHELTPAGSTT